MVKILSNTRKMSPTSAFHFFSVVLFFVTMGEGIIAEDLKIELPDQKDTEQTKQSNYLHNSVNEAKQLNYKYKVNIRDPNPWLPWGGRQAKKYNEVKARDNPWLPWSSRETIKTNYNNEVNTHDPNPWLPWGSRDTKKPNYNYEVKTHDPNPWLLWGSRETKKPNYNYEVKTHDPNPWLPWGSRETKNPNYNYEVNTHHPNPWLPWGSHESKNPNYNNEVNTHDPNPWLPWGSRETKNPNYNNEVNTHDPNPWLPWGSRDTKKPNYNYEVKTHDPNPWLPWGSRETKNPNYNNEVNTHHPNPWLPWGSRESKNPNYNNEVNTLDPNPWLPWGSHETKNPNYNNEVNTYDPNPWLPWGSRETKNPNYNYEVKTHDLNPWLPWGSRETKNPNYNYKVNTHDHNPWLPWGSRETQKPNYNYEVNTHDPNTYFDHTEAFEKGFFNLEDLHVGNVMTLQFSVQETSPLFSRKEADSIPFSVSQLPSVLQLFSIPEDSLEAKTMRGTLEHCQEETVIGETKICANSVESMREFVDTIIGSESKHMVLTTSNPSPSAIPLQKYTILKVSHDIDAPKWVSCHPLPYPYAIYYCHTMTTGTKVFKVTLVGDANGDKMEAIGMCHLDTSDWNPNHMIFKTLRVEPGKDTPVCHFFSINHLLWIPFPDSKATV